MYKYTPGLSSGKRGFFSHNGWRFVRPTCYTGTIQQTARLKRRHMAILFSAVVVLVLILIGMASESKKRDCPTNIEDGRDSATTETDTEVDIFKLLPRKFIILDLETTGLSPLNDEIIEIGAVLITLGESSHKTFQQLIKPKKKIPARITTITGISQNMVDECGVTIEEALPRFLEFIGDLPLVTYNAEFDMGFLWSAAKKNNIEIKNRYTCALKRTRRAWPGLPSYKLAYIAEVTKISDENQHRALGDCYRTAHIFLAATCAVNRKVRWSVPQ